MESPPPFAPPRKKSKTGLIVGIVVLVLVVCCGLPIAVIGGFGYLGFTKGKGMIQCTFALQYARDGMLQYAAEHDGKLPPAETWQSEIKSYYEKEISHQKDDMGPFKVPSIDVPLQCSGEGASTGIAYNSDIAGKVLSALKAKSDTVVLFEIPSTEMNAHQPYTEMDIKKAPTILGAPRGWLMIGLEGDPEVLSKSGKKVKIRSRSGYGGTSIEPAVPNG